LNGVRSIGLTGGIGSGKSTVGQMLVEGGATLVDTDAIARRLTLPGGAAIPALLAEFGPDALAADGGLDRTRMRTLAFSDSAVRTRLEALLHPLIGSESLRQAAQAGGRVLVFDVPLLTESAHWRARVDRVLVIDCLEATQVQRASRRAGWTADTVRSVIAQQAMRATRRAIADAVIFNDGLTLEQLAQEVLSLSAWWRLGR
jgi:dephospho-CoA kinase